MHKPGELDSWIARQADGCSVIFEEGEGAVLEVGAAGGVLARLARDQPIFYDDQGATDE